MKLKLLTTIIIGLCLTLISTATTFAGTGDTMIEKQREIDQYIFEDNAEELAEKGITVTHTGPLEDTVEIGISPYTQENINYLFEVFGEDQVTIVDGQMAVTFNVEGEQVNALVDDSTKVTTNPNNSPYYIIAIILGLAGLVFAIQKKNRMNK